VIVVVDQFGHASHGDASRLDDDLEGFVLMIGMGRAAGVRTVVFAPRPTLSVPPIRAALRDRLDSVRPVPGPLDTRVEGFVRRLDALEGVDVFDEPGMLAAAGCGSRACFDGHTASADPLYRDLHHLSGFGASFAFGAFAVPDARR
jgi:hypothetical protein